jgi:hypothetical protein
MTKRRILSSFGHSSFEFRHWHIGLQFDSDPSPSTIFTMLRFALAIVLLGLIAGCDGTGGFDRSALDQKMFGPASIRLHPTFTQVRDVSGKGKVDGIEVTLEVQDKFGESTRSTGRVMFELFGYRKDSPDVRGLRIGGPWVANLDTRAEQDEHWNAALRAYTFELSFPHIRRDRYYVLTAQFDLNSAAALTQPSTEPVDAAQTQPAGRLFAELIIEPQIDDKANDIKRKAITGLPGHDQ